MERLYNVFWNSSNNNNVLAIESSDECSHSSSMSRSAPSSRSSYSESLSYTSSDSSLISHTSAQKCKSSMPISHRVSKSSNLHIARKSNESITTPKLWKKLERNRIETNCNVHSSKCITSSAKSQNSFTSSLTNSAHGNLCLMPNSSNNKVVSHAGDNNKSLTRYPSTSSHSLSCKEDEYNNWLMKTNSTLNNDDKLHFRSSANSSFVSDRQVSDSFSVSLPALSPPPLSSVHKRNSFHHPESSKNNYSSNKCNMHKNWEINSKAHESYSSSQSRSIDSMEEHEHYHKVKHNISNARQALSLYASPDMKVKQYSASNSAQQLTKAHCSTHEVHGRPINILVIGTPESGKSSFINTYRECVAFHGRWPVAPVGACGGAGTLTAEPFPDNAISPSWLCIDTPGTIFNIFDERKLKMLVSEKMITKTREEQEITQNMLNQSEIAVQCNHYSNSIVLDKLLAGIPWHTQLAGLNKMTDNEIVRLPVIHAHSAHQCIIVVAATELITDCGWSRSLLRKPRYAELHKKVRFVEENECYHERREKYEQEEEIKQMELECDNDTCTLLGEKIPERHCKEHICQSTTPSITSTIVRAATEEMLPSCKREHELLNERECKQEHSDMKALTSITLPTAIDVNSSTVTSNHSVKEIVHKKQQLENVSIKTRVTGGDVMFVEYLQELILYIREKANDLIPHVVITKMDCVGGAGCLEARQAITKLLGKCISRNRIYFIANNTLTDNVLPFDNWNNKSVDACTRHECLRLHQHLSLELIWRMQVVAHNNSNNIYNKSSNNNISNVFRSDDNHQ